MKQLTAFTLSLALTGTLILNQRTATGQPVLPQSNLTLLGLSAQPR
ncbi:hypothetical protein [Leptolyngbya sp. FACHB-261]|nr:hypothetical protein [Leptolyngbya sp. FACHB-261]